MMLKDRTIGVANLRLKYPGDGPLLFKGVSFSVMPGERVLLLGPSGCGKSTLLQVLSGIVPGVVEIPLKADDIRIPERWGYVFQDPDTQFCMPYVDEEIAFVLENLQVPRDEMPASIRRYLAMVGLQFDEAHIPIAHLSQGMKQRLAIASVLALEPEVLFLDEPTALLDEEGTAQVWETIRSVSTGRTLLIVEHKISGILDLIDRIVIIGPEGELLADGRPETVFKEHKRKLMEYGIWYPGVWDDYDSRSSADAAGEMPPGTAQEAVRMQETAELLDGAALRRQETVALTEAQAIQIQDAQAPPNDEAVQIREISAQSAAEAVQMQKIPAQSDAEAVRMQETRLPVHAEASRKPESPVTPQAEALLEFHDFQALRDGACIIAVNHLSVHPGEWIAIVGRNGAGKSSLLLAIMRLLRTKGSCRIAGVKGMKVEDAAEKIAFVFQNPEFQFVTHSVEDEIAYSLQEELPLSRKHQEAAEELLRQYNLTDLRSRHPFQLSTGQKRRLSVASAIVREQPIVLLDEPTFGLDARNTFMLLERLEHMRKRGAAILMVTHDPEIVARFATRVWQVSGGRLTDRVPPRLATSTGQITPAGQAAQTVRADQAAGQEEEGVLCN